MTTTPQKYQASTRLIDDEAQLRQLYCERDLTIREIADQYASVGRTRVSDALADHGITDNDNETDSETCSSARMTPQTTESPQSTVSWQRTTD